MWWVYVLAFVGVLLLWKLIRRRFRIAAYKRKYGRTWRKEMWYRQYYPSAELELTANLMYLRGEFHPATRPLILQQFYPMPFPRSEYELPAGEDVSDEFMRAYRKEIKRVLRCPEDGIITLSDLMRAYPPPPMTRAQGYTRWPTASLLELMRQPRLPASILRSMRQTREMLIRAHNILMRADKEKE